MRRSLYVAPRPLSINCQAGPLTFSVTSSDIAITGLISTGLVRSAGSSRVAFRRPLAEARGRRGAPCQRSSAAPSSSRSAAVTSSKTASAPSSPCSPPRKTVPAYMLSATPSAASPQTIKDPLLHHESGHRPTLPATISIPPFIAMPARVEASPRTTTVPARIEAATALPASPSITTVPSRMLSPAPQPAPPWTMTVAPSFKPRDVVADAPFDRQLDALGQGDAQVVPRRRVGAGGSPVAPAAIAARIAWLIARTGRSPQSSVAIALLHRDRRQSLVSMRPQRIKTGPSRAAARRRE